jgi:hypothetical protein
VDVTARDEEVAGASFNEACGRAEVLNLSRIRGDSDQHRIATRLRGPMYICEQRHSVAHGHGDVIIVFHGQGRSRKVAVLAACRLRAVESTLSGSIPAAWCSLNLALLVVKRIFVL